MLKSIATAVLSLFLANSALARPAVISSYKVSSSPSKLGQDLRTVHVQGTVLTRPETCETSRSRTELRLGEREDRYVLSVHVVPFVIAPGLPCLPAGESSNLSFSATYELDSSVIEATDVWQVKSAGESMPLNELIKQSAKAPASADECSLAKTFSPCPLLLWPSTCSYLGMAANGVNECEAKKLLRHQACQKENNFDSSLVTCKQQNR